MAHEISPDDLCILVIGRTGSGKSSFISKATGKAIKTNRGLESCTMDISAYEMGYKYKNRRIWLIDTPGFGNRYRTESQIDAQFSDWRDQLEQRDKIYDGVIYLHSITDNKMDDAAYGFLMDLHTSMGTSLDYLTAKEVILVTTMWAHVQFEEGEFREHELRAQPDFWGKLCDDGTQICRHTDDYNSAMNIIRCLVEGVTAITDNMMASQMGTTKELKLEDTEAGKELKELETTRKRYQEEIKQTQKETLLVLQQVEDNERERIEAPPRQRRIDGAETGPSSHGIQNPDISMLKKLFEEQTEKFNRVIESLNQAQIRMETELSTIRISAIQSSYDLPPTYSSYENDYND